MSKPNWSDSAEALVVGAILLDSSSMDRVVGDLSSSHFHHAGLRRIWNAARVLWEDGDQFSAVDVFGKLSDVDQGLAEEVLSEAATSANIVHYGRQVRKEAERRDLRALADKVIERVGDRSLDPADIAEEMATCLHKLNAGDEDDFCNLATGVQDFFDDLEKRVAGEISIGISTPFPKLDNYIGAWEEELVYIIGARPSVGKSAMAMQIGMNAAKKGHKVLYLILETSRRQWMRRVVSSVSGVSTMAMKRGQVAPDQMVAVTKACNSLSNLDTVTLWDAPHCTPNKLRAETMKAQRQGGVDLLVVDYVQLMSGGGRFESRRAELGHVSREMVAIAKTLKIPVICLAQLNRDVQGRDGELRMPVLTDLKECGDFEQDAAAVMFLHRKNLVTTETELVIAKQRDGPVGGVDLVFDKQAVRFKQK